LHSGNGLYSNKNDVADAGRLALPLHDVSVARESRYKCSI